jgi:hypothetical protein
MTHSDKLKCVGHNAVRSVCRDARIRGQCPPSRSVHLVTRTSPRRLFHARRAELRLTTHFQLKFSIVPRPTPPIRPPA